MRLVCGPAEDCAVALALAGALALQRTILALQEMGGLLRRMSGTPPPVVLPSPSGFTGSLPAIPP